MGGLLAGGLYSPLIPWERKEKTERQRDRQKQPATDREIDSPPRKGPRAPSESVALPHCGPYTVVCLHGLAVRPDTPPKVYLDIRSLLCRAKSLLILSPVVPEQLHTALLLQCLCLCLRDIQTDRQSDRQTVRRTDRQTDRQTVRQTDRQTDQGSRWTLNLAPRKTLLDALIHP